MPLEVRNGECLQNVWKWPILIDQSHAPEISWRSWHTLPYPVVLAYYSETGTSTFKNDRLRSWGSVNLKAVESLKAGMAGLIFSYLAVFSRSVGPSS